MYDVMLSIENSDVTQDGHVLASHRGDS